MCFADQLWYLVSTLIAWAYFSEEGKDSPVLRRPSWAPVWLLRGARRWYRAFTFCLAGLGLLLATELVGVFWLRAAYGLCVFLADFVAFAAYGGHTGFVFFYTALAMLLPPGSTRSGVLRLIVAHQLGSPAVNKLQTGGWKWLDPSTLESHIRFARERELPFKPHCVVEPPWIRRPGMMDLCLRHPWLLALMHWAGLATQLLVVLACLLGGQVALSWACAAACSFHVLAAPLLGIVFPFSIPCYMLALLPSSAHDVSCLRSFPALVTALLLGTTTFFATEDWPLNGLAVFPYNAEQMKVLQSIFGRYLLAHSEGEPRASGICLTELCVSICPANLYPCHLKALGGGSFGDSAEFLLSNEVAAKLSEWLRHTRRFIDERADGQPGRCFDDVVVAEISSESARLGA
ncbi:cmdD [Symbiodinium natans]|uniref:CmdD protein n=1 Tax=Symbiodinium natans TaxID=878477 RepID=A0A812NFW1_9DINO|nr:cmdD [Symbiodinium natans]